MPVSEATYQRVAMEDDEQWELVCGRLRKKPPMTAEHNFIPRRLSLRLGMQLREDEYVIAEGSGKLRTSTGSFYIPDLCVIPMSYIRRMHEQPGTFEAHAEPVPFVLEVWSPTLVCGDPYIPAEVGEYDVDTKLPEYRARGDAEVWRIHPTEHTLIAWRRQPDGDYAESIYRHGPVQIASLPSVSINLDELFL